jgi:hypothetical protein
MQDSLANNRETATFIIFSVVLLAFLLSSGVRQACKPLVGTLALPRLAIPLVAYLAWIGLSVWGAWRLGLWTPSLAGSTVLWLVGVGLAWFLRLGDANKSRFFRGRILKLLGLGALLNSS